MTEPSPDTFPRQNARTLRFSLGRPRSFSISDDGATVLFVRSGSGTDRVGCLWSWTEQAGEVELVNPGQLLGGAAEDLSHDELARRERAREAAGGIVSYTVDASFSRVAFTLSGRLFVTEVAESTTREITVAGSVIDPRIDPTGQEVAFVADRRLHAVAIDSAVTRIVSPHEPSETVTWGLADFIAAEELDRSRGFWWSPDGTQLLAQRTDVEPVGTWFVSSPATPAEAPTAQRYPAAGTPNAKVTLWLLDLEGSAVQVDLPADTEYLASLDWSERGAPTAATLDRTQKTMTWVTIDRDTGATRQVRSVSDDAWVDVVPGTGVWDTAGRLLTVEVRNDDYALCADGTQVSPPGLQVRGVVGVDDQHITVLAAADPGTQQVWSLADGQWQLRSPTEGWHALAEAGSTRVLVSANLERALPVATISTKTATHEIASLAAQPMLEIALTLLPGDGERPRVALLLPTGWNPAMGSLPVLMDPYGGPHHVSVAHHQGAFRESQWLADQGFAVVVVDGRGTPGSPSWERAIRGNFAQPVLDDQIVGLHAVAHAFPQLDLDRVAIRGWSFGGYLAALAVIDRPDIFHAAIAGAPVTDWKLYDTGYTERYLGVPTDEDDAAYVRSSLLDRAPRLTRPLQLIHGLADDNVFVAHSLRLSQVLTEHGRPHEVLPLTGITHMATQEDVAENLLSMQVDFLRRSLGATQG